MVNDIVIIVIALVTHNTYFPHFIFFKYGYTFKLHSLFTYTKNEHYVQKELAALATSPRSQGGGNEVVITKQHQKRVWACTSKCIASVASWFWYLHFSIVTGRASTENVRNEQVV